MIQHYHFAPSQPPMRRFFVARADVTRQPMLHCYAFCLTWRLCILHTSSIAPTNAERTGPDAHRATPTGEARGSRPKGCSVLEAMGSIHREQPGMVFKNLICRCCWPTCGPSSGTRAPAGMGRSSARYLHRAQSAKARYTAKGVRGRRPRTGTVTPVGIPASPSQEGRILMALPRAIRIRKKRQGECLGCANTPCTRLRRERARHWPRPCHLIRRGHYGLCRLCKK